MEAKKTEFPQREHVAVTVLKIIFLLICVVLAGIHIKDELDYRKIYEQTTENALNYIRNKYDFEAEIVIAPDKNSREWTDESHYVLLKMKYGGKEFAVQVNKYKDNTKYVDSYQADEIKAAAKEYLSELFPDGTIVEFEYSDTNSYFFDTADDYFDGENIAEILKNSNGYIEMVFADRTFSEEDIEKLPDGFSTELISFVSEKRKDEFLSLKGDGLYYYSNYNLFAPYINDHIGRRNNTITEVDIQLTELDEFKYVYFARGDFFEFPKSDKNAGFEYAEHGEINDAYKRADEEQWLTKPLSKEYYLDFIPSAVWIYYPLDKLSGYDLEDIGLAMFDHGGGINCRNILRAEICGEYAVFRIGPGDDCYFMFIDTSGLGEYPPIS